MAFNPAGCVTALAAYLNTVPGITAGAGIVHTRRRIVRSESDIKALLVGSAGNGKVNAWMISPAAADPMVADRGPGFNAIGSPGGGRVKVTLQYAVEGYYQIDDAAGSEETFRDLAFVAADGLNKIGILAISGAVMQLPANQEQFGFVMLAGLALYHYVRIGVGWHGQTQP